MILGRDLLKKIRATSEDEGIAELDDEEYVDTVVTLVGIDAKRNGKDPWHEILQKLDVEHHKLVSKSKDAVGQYRTNYLAMIRGLYKDTFFPNCQDYRRNPRDVHQRLKDKTKYSEDQFQKIKFVINEDYLDAVEEFSRTVEEELFQGFLYIKRQKDSKRKKLLEIPCSK